MTEVVVTQSGNTQVVQDQRVNRVVTDDKPARVITSGMAPPPMVNNISNSADIDVTNVQEGSLLVYNTATNKWTATNILENVVIESGQF
jgi:hypothetical protein